MVNLSMLGTNFLGSRGEILDKTKKYEITYLLQPEYAEEGKEEKIERLQTILQNAGAEVEDVEEWGKRKLAYNIDNYSDGYYILFNFKSPPEKTEEITERSNVEEGVLRYQVDRRE